MHIQDIHLNSTTFTLFILAIITFIFESKLASVYISASTQNFPPRR